MKTSIDTDLRELLSQCIVTCNQCAVACLREEHVRMLRHCIQLDLDCAQICETTLGFVGRDSSQVYRLYAVCAAICTACAEECEKHEKMDHCARCAQQCRECAEACLAMNRN